MRYEVTPGYNTDEMPQSKVVGCADDLSVTDSELKQAIDNRSARVLFLTSESHSRNFFSIASAENTVHFFVDALSTMEENSHLLNQTQYHTPTPYSC